MWFIQLLVQQSRVPLANIGTVLIKQISQFFHERGLHIWMTLRNRNKKWLTLVSCRRSSSLHIMNYITWSLPRWLSVPSMKPLDPWGVVRLILPNGHCCVIWRWLCGDILFMMPLLSLYLLLAACTHTCVPGSNGCRWRCTSPFASRSSFCTFAIACCFRLGFLLQYWSIL